MYQAVAAFVVILFLVALFTWGILYWRYYVSAEYRWKSRVSRLLRAAKAHLQLERGRLQALDSRRSEEAQQLADQAFSRYLLRIPVNELEKYSGIGPATIARLKEARTRTLADAWNRRTAAHTYGLGAKREKAVSEAVSTLVREAHGRFQAGGCPESEEANRQLADLGPKYEGLAIQGRARIKALQVFIAKLEDHARLAQEISFWRHYMSESKDHLLPSQAASLPDLDDFIAMADEESKSRFREPKAFPVAQVVNPESSDLFAATVSPGFGEREVAQPKVRTDAKVALLQSPASTEIPEPTKAGPHHLDVMDLTVALAFAAARADGRIARKERDVIEEQLTRRYQYDVALYNRAKAFCAHYESAAIDLDGCLMRIKELCSQAHRKMLLDLVVQVAEATGPINERERSFLAKISRQLEVELPGASSRPTPSQDLPGAKPIVTPVAADSAVTTHEQRLSLLEIAPSVSLSAELIRRQYHLLLNRLALEKFQAAGTDFVEMAKAKRAAIQEAAITLMQPIGEKLDLDEVPSAPTDIRENLDLDAAFGV